MCLGPKGEITEHGTFADLKDSGGYVSSFCLSRADRTFTPNDDATIVLADDGDDMTSTLPKENDYGASISSSEPLSYTIEKEDDKSRQTGDVQIYLYYVKAVGWWASLTFVFAIVGFVFCTSFPSKWF